MIQVQLLGRHALSQVALLMCSIEGWVRPIHEMLSRGRILDGGSAALGCKMAQVIRYFGTHDPTIAVCPGCDNSTLLGTLAFNNEDQLSDLWNDNELLLIPDIASLSHLLHFYTENGCMHLGIIDVQVHRSPIVFTWPELRGYMDLDEQPATIERIWMQLVSQTLDDLEASRDAQRLAHMPVGTGAW